MIALQGWEGGKMYISMIGESMLSTSLITKLDERTRAHYKVVILERRPYQAGSYRACCAAFRHCWKEAVSRAAEELDLSATDLEVIHIWGTESAPPDDTHRSKDLS
jgi:hypothetical protein